MKNIKVNSKTYKTNSNDIAELKSELNITDELVIYKGFGEIWGGG